MAVACSCTNPTSGSATLYYDGTDPLACDDTVATYYAAAGPNPTAYMIDFIMGACSFHSCPTMAELAQSIQENGGHGGNWFQVSSAVISDYVNYLITPHNVTGQTFDTAYGMSGDAINASIGIWYMRQLLDYANSHYRYTGHTQLLTALNAYNSGSYSTEQAYGASVLWKGYGSNWSTASSTSYLGPYFPAGPEGTQCRANTGSGSVQASLPTPGFPVPTFELQAPLGYNDVGRRTLILAGPGATEDYVSGIFVEQWYFTSPYNEAMLLADANIAAYCAAIASKDYCVIALGEPAIMAIQNAASSLGLTLVAYEDFSLWESGAQPGYIDCAGTTGAVSYQEGLAAAQQSASAGWG